MRVPVCRKIRTRDRNILWTSWIFTITLKSPELADLRGLAPKERVPLLIENCAHPTYRKQLYEYYEEACQNGGHTPHHLEKAFSWHTRFSKHGIMLESAPQPN